MRMFARYVLSLSLLMASSAAFAGLPPNVLIQPANSTDFGNVAFGQSVVRSITITAPATNSQPISGVNPILPPGFAIDVGGTCDALSSLAPGQSCTFNVRFTPTGPTTTGGLVTATCSTAVSGRVMVAGFTITCDSQAAGPFAQFVAAAVAGTVPVLSPALITLLALVLLGFGARSALRRVKR